MAVLTREIILNLISCGRIGLEPFSEEQVGPASIDLHLSNNFRIFREAEHPFRVTDEGDYSRNTVEIFVPDEDCLMLMPGKTCFGITMERVSLPPNICGLLQMRSRFSRSGVVLQGANCFIPPGIDNKLLLAVTNAGQAPMNLVPKVALCQIILEQCIGNATHHRAIASNGRLPTVGIRLLNRARKLKRGDVD